MFPLLGISWLEALFYTLATTHISIISVTIYLHRCCAHRSVELHPKLRYFFRFWLWLTTGQVEQEWVAVHRCHHAYADRKGDPHSPQLFGVWQILILGWKYYRTGATNASILEKYGNDCSDDFLEKYVFAKYSYAGVILLLLLEVTAFGVTKGLVIWLVQMLWIPIWAAGVINGLSHWIGYRNYKLEDFSRNLYPIAFWIGGEELHNNHHCNPACAKFSHKSWEFDIGWMYIKLLAMLQLAKPRPLPQVLITRNKHTGGCDQTTTQAFLQQHVMVLTQFTKQVIVPVIQEERLRLKDKINHKVLEQFRKIAVLPELESAKQTYQHLYQSIERFPQLAKVCHMRSELLKLGKIRNISEHKLLEKLECWCIKAEESGIQALATFSFKMRSYAQQSPAI